MSQHTPGSQPGDPGFVWDPRLNQWLPIDVHNMQPQKPKRRVRVIGAIVGVGAFLLLVSQCGQDEQSGAGESQSSVFTAASPATSSTAPRTALIPESVEVPDTDRYVEDQTMSAIFPTFIESTGIPIEEHSARVIAAAGCATLREVSYPGDPDADATLYGMGTATVQEYPRLDVVDVATIIGAGVLVYCPEFEGSFG